jgi:hypothetical protein
LIDIITGKAQEHADGYKAYFAITQPAIFRDLFLSGQFFLSANFMTVMGPRYFSYHLCSLLKGGVKNKCKILLR